MISRQSAWTSERCSVVVLGVVGGEFFEFLRQLQCRVRHPRGPGGGWEGPVTDGTISHAKKAPIRRENTPF